MSNNLFMAKRNKKFTYFLQQYVICETTKKNKPNKYHIQKAIVFLGIEWGHRDVNKFVYKTFNRAKQALEKKARADFLLYRIQQKKKQELNEQS